MRSDPSVSFGFEREAPRPDDYASMLAELELRLDREVLRRILVASERELDDVGAGHTPEPQLAARICLLYDLGRRTDLGDPQAVVRALLGAEPDQAATRVLARVFTSRRGVLLAFAAFAALDVVIAAAIVVYVAAS